jgi:uncharacterized NAD-dependent epimerase/dehydratase family protein
MEYVQLTPLPQLRLAYETMAALMQPAPVIGIAMNTRGLDAAAAERERKRVRTEMGLPACDVLRHGPDELVEAVLDLQSEVMS